MDLSFKNMNEYAACGILFPIGINPQKTESTIGFIENARLGLVKKTWQKLATMNEKKSYSKAVCTRTIAWTGPFYGVSYTCLES